MANGYLSIRNSVAFISDNGRQFDNKAFKSFCSKLGIESRLTSVTHPQTNGQVEVANLTLLQTLKTWVSKNGTNWVEEIPSALWAYRTTARTPTGESPFSLTYGAEAVIPAEIGMPTLRTQQTFSLEENEKNLRAELDLLEERRETAETKAAIYRQRVKRFYDTRVKRVFFQIGDLVLRENEFQGNKS
ncbi:hypothetical protein J5N97_020586 [Dioscorea zingiberensis]|uniref:Integrase catalytic domain-containing protein n=1 Tax=Dioscorea zingiberensis TaxID=325984 RepID=A0A9D5CHB9_9LILI|nr:hypothetical protein J5N97_020586 [Dioscorea zingiberensis]